MSIFDSDAPFDGNRATATAHRRIELQSPLDLSYLISNVQKDARDKIDRHLPPDAAPAGTDDEMRKRVVELVDKYVRDTFDAAKDSITINGMDPREMEAEMARAQDGEETEPFDAKLAQRVQTLTAQIEHQTLQLANLRRTAPAKTARQFEDAFATHSREYDERLQVHGARSVAEATTTKMDLDEIPRVDDMRERWASSTDGLDRLRNGLGGTVAEMEKAKRAMEYVCGT